jgi:hypothetical protein
MRRYPFDYTASVDGIAAATGGARIGGPEFDLTPIIEDLRNLRSAIQQWRAGAGGTRPRPPTRRSVAQRHAAARACSAAAQLRVASADHDPAIKRGRSRLERRPCVPARRPQ